MVFEQVLLFSRRSSSLCGLKLRFVSGLSYYRAYRRGRRPNRFQHRLTKFEWRLLGLRHFPSRSIRSKPLHLGKSNSRRRSRARLAKLRRPQRFDLRRWPKLEVALPFAVRRFRRTARAQVLFRQFGTVKKFDRFLSDRFDLGPRYLRFLGRFRFRGQLPPFLGVSTDPKQVDFLSFHPGGRPTTPPVVDRQELTRLRGRPSRISLGRRLFRVVPRRRIKVRPRNLSQLFKMFNADDTFLLPKPRKLWLEKIRLVRNSSLSCPLDPRPFSSAFLGLRRVRSDLELRFHQAFTLFNRLRALRFGRTFSLARLKHSRPDPALAERRALFNLGLSVPPSSRFRRVGLTRELELRRCSRRCFDDMFVPPLLWREKKRFDRNRSPLMSRTRLLIRRSRSLVLRTYYLWQSSLLRPEAARRRTVFFALQVQALLTPRRSLLREIVDVPGLSRKGIDTRRPRVMRARPLSEGSDWKAEAQTLLTELGSLSRRKRRRFLRRISIRRGQLRRISRCRQKPQSLIPDLLRKLALRVGHEEDRWSFRRLDSFSFRRAFKGNHLRRQRRRFRWRRKEVRHCWFKRGPLLWGYPLVRPGFLLPVRRPYKRRGGFWKQRREGRRHFWSLRRWERRARRVRSGFRPRHRRRLREFQRQRRYRRLRYVRRFNRVPWFVWDGSRRQRRVRTRLLDPVDLTPLFRRLSGSPYVSRDDFSRKVEFRFKKSGQIRRVASLLYSRLEKRQYRVKPRRVKPRITTHRRALAGVRHVLARAITSRRERSPLQRVLAELGQPKTSFLLRQQKFDKAMEDVVL